MGPQHSAQLSAFMLALLRYGRPLAEQAGRRLAAHRLACPSGVPWKQVSCLLPTTTHWSLEM